MKQVILAILFVSLCTKPALSQTLNNPTARNTANIISWASVGASIAFDTKASWDNPHRERALVLQGVRTGATVGASMLLKHYFPTARPCKAEPFGCGREDPMADLPSQHVALAMQARGGPRLAIVIPLGAITAWGRNASGMHDTKGIALGTALGFATSFIR